MILLVKGRPLGSERVKEYFMINTFYGNHDNMYWFAGFSNHFVDQVYYSLLVCSTVNAGLDFQERPWGELAPKFSDIVTSKSISVKSKEI